MFQLGLTSRPMPLGAPPRDVVRQILARAADSHHERQPEPEHSMREIIAIAHRGNTLETRHSDTDGSCYMSNNISTTTCNNIV